MKLRFLFKILFLILLKLNFLECHKKLSDPKSYNIVVKDLEDNFEVKTKGRPVPLPQIYKPSNTQYILNEKEFSFKFTAASVVCDVLTLAFTRYHKIIFRPHTHEINMGQRNVKKIKFNKDKHKFAHESLDYMKRLMINVHDPCEDYPSLDTDESCRLFL
jgi:hypothetical protein